MDNVLQTNGVPLTVFGGAVPELAPEDLPEGASPFNQDVDFNPGSVFTRGGRSNQYYYQGLTVTRNTGAASSFPDPGIPSEAPWQVPTNVQSGTIGTDAICYLPVADPVDRGSFGVDGLDVHAGGAFPATYTVNCAATDFLIAYLSTNGAFNVNSPWIGNDIISNESGFGFHLPTLGGNISPTQASITFSSIGATPPVPGILMALRTNGTLPALIQSCGGNNGGGNCTITVGGSVGWGLNLGANHILWAVASVNIAGNNPTGQVAQYSLTDTSGNQWQLVASQNLNVAGAFNGVWIFYCSNPVVGVKPSITITFRNAQGGIVNSNGSTMSFQIGEASNVTTVTSVLKSQVLQCEAYGFSILPTQTVLGMQVLLQGKQTNSDPSSIVTAQLVTPGVPPVVFSGQLSTGTEATLTLATPLTPWNVQFTPALVNSGTFGINVQASSAIQTTFSLSAVQIRLFLTPLAANFNWLHTYEQTDAEVDTLALDSNGVLWDEDVDTNPGVLISIFTNILANTFAKGVTFNDIEYIAFSNLLNGTDVPRQWNGTNLDRISMVGPGAAPTAAVAGGSGGSNTTAIQSITQNAPVQIRRIAFGTVNSPGDSTPGNLLVIFGEGRTGANTYASLAPYTASFGAATTVVLSSITNPFPLKGGGSLPFNLNGTYTIQQVTTGIVGGNESCPIFTIPSPTTTWAYSNDFGSSGPPPTSGWFYQSCLATITMQAPLPNVGVGSQIQITGTGGSPPSGYDGTWTVLQAPNASSMTINSAIVSGGVATYSFTLAAGSAAPQVNQLVTVQNCLNGSGIGNLNVFNVTAVAISAVTGGTFSVAVNSPDIPLQNQVGNVPSATATIGGTIFVFDAGAIVGTKSGGTVVGQGQVGVGVRKLCYCFLTRSGYITQPSPIATFNVTSGAGSISVANLSTGPPNVVARIVCFTGANGGNFFYIPQAVSVTVGGVVTINSSTIIQDNSSTSATFSFSDAVLLSATAIDIPGNNLFNTIELGSCRGLLTYASRMFAWSEQTKVTNLRNLSFDGGFQGVNVQGATISAPLGWTIDATNGAGGSLNFNSPIFGWAYQIQNTSGSTQATYGMLTQPAYVDEFGVPIIQASTLYSVRITAQCSPAQASGNLVVDLFSPGIGVSLGTFSIPLSSMTTAMQIYTGTLLTTILQPVPKDLIIRIWAQNILNGATISIDRVEPFSTLAPVNTTALKASYANNQEAFDLVTGVCGPAQNMQPLNGAMELFDLLYALKEKSWFSTFDNGVTEPNKWNWKEVSNKIGTIGINSYDWGEGWALTGNRQGVFFFEGGEPIKVSQEIQPLWDLINWQFGYTMWLRNDPEQRRFTVGVPIPTPNPYMPEFPVNANPTSPNVILMCNYRELNSGAALAQTGPIRSTYTGRLMSPEPARKWSFWNIACPYSDYISRANNQWPQFFGTGYNDNKIFALIASQLSDDGNAINSFWISYGFVKPEMADAKGLGLFRMEFPYFTVLATGSGTLNTYVYPESPQNRPYVLDPQTLPATTQGDLEIGVNITGQRFFIRVGTNAVGSAFRCSKMVVPLIPDSWSPIRGSNLVTA
jgi:hypothetical protein